MLFYLKNIILNTFFQLRLFKLSKEIGGKNKKIQGK